MARRAIVPALSATALPALLAPLLLAGCVERKLVIRSDPPGALVSLEDEPVPGRTPVEVPFEWDGVRRVTLQKAGHRVLETTADVQSRWYDWFPLDVFAQFLWPGTIRDVRTFDYRLEPYADWQALPDDARKAEDADDRARLAALRDRAESYHAGGSAGPGGTAPPALPESRSAAKQADKPTEPRARADRTPPPAILDVPRPVPPGVTPPPPAPPPPLFPPDDSK